MSSNHGRLCRDIVGGSLQIKSKQVLDKQSNLKVNDATISGQTSLKGNVLVDTTSTMTVNGTLVLNNATIVNPGGLNLMNILVLERDEALATAASEFPLVFDRAYNNSEMSVPEDLRGIITVPRAGLYRVTNTVRRINTGGSPGWTSWMQTSSQLSPGYLNIEEEATSLISKVSTSAGILAVLNDNTTFTLNAVIGDTATTFSFHLAIERLGDLPESA